MNKLLLVLIVVLVLGGGYYLMKGKSADKSVVPVEQKVMEASGATGASAAVMDKEAVKEFTVEGNEFAFAPKILTAAKGDTVKVVFTNTGKYPHNFMIKELNVAGKTVQPGESDTVTFTAEKAGSFEYYCGIGTHAEKGMVGTLTVE